MKYNPLLEPYKALVPFLAELLGESCEILLHDISQPKHSVIAIANGFHTGRKVGSPFTDLAIKIMEEKAYVKRDYLANYNGRSKNKNFVSSTFFIKHEGKVIGLLCINRNMDAMTELDLVLQKLKKAYNLEGALDDTDESMDTPVGDILPRMVASEMRAVGVPPERMTREEKRNGHPQSHERRYPPDEGRCRRDCPSASFVRTDSVPLYQAGKRGGQVRASPKKLTHPGFFS